MSIGMGKIIRTDRWTKAKRDARGKHPWPDAPRKGPWSGLEKPKSRGARWFGFALVASGIWFADFLLRQSPSLAAIQGDAEFERLNQISAQMRAADGTVLFAFALHKK